MDGSNDELGFLAIPLVIAFLVMLLITDFRYLETYLSGDLFFSMQRGMAFATKCYQIIFFRCLGFYSYLLFSDTLIVIVMHVFGNI